MFVFEQIKIILNWPKLTLYNNVATIYNEHIKTKHSVKKMKQT